jgi:hypothetical protein
LKNNENFAVTNVVIFLEIVMKLPFSPDLFIYSRSISGEKRQKKNKNENFAEYTKRGITAWVKESRKKFQSTVGGKKL